MHLVRLIKQRPHKAEQRHEDDDDKAHKGKAVLEEGPGDKTPDAARIVRLSTFGHGARLGDRRQRSFGEAHRTLTLVLAAVSIMTPGT